MPAQTDTRERRDGPRPLSKHEIDRRIEGAVSSVFEGEDGAADLAPRWIAAADLVRRVSPFLSKN